MMTSGYWVRSLLEGGAVIQNGIIADTFELLKLSTGNAFTIQNPTSNIQNGIRQSPLALRETQLLPSALGGLSFLGYCS
jgi:hypothetical protein